MTHFARLGHVKVVVGVATQADIAWRRADVLQYAVHWEQEHTVHVHVLLTIFGARMEIIRRSVTVELSQAPLLLFLQAGEVAAW